MRGVALAAMAATGMVVGASTPAYSWVHPLEQTETYFMPGGPEEHWLNACIVETRLAKFQPGDVAYLTTMFGVWNGLNTVCHLDYGSIQIVTYNGYALENGPVVAAKRLGQAVGLPGSNTGYSFGFAASTGRYGSAIFGANVCATNINYLTKCWQITVF